MPDRGTVHALYRKLLTFYPPSFRERFGESMEQTFNDLYRDQKQKSEGGLVGFVLWLFIETAVGIVRERILAADGAANGRHPAMTIQKWGGLAFFVLAAIFIIAPLLYFVGPNQPGAPLKYNLADFVNGPLLAASLVLAVFTMREQLGKVAPRRMTLALLSAAMAAGLIVLAILIRSSNRHYHLMHPELNLESATTVLIVWEAMITGIIAAGYHFLGWSLVLIGSAGWTSRLLPRGLSALYVVAGIVSLLSYLQADNESVIAFGMLVSIWQGILLWRDDSGATRAPEPGAGLPAQV